MSDLTLTLLRLGLLALLWVFVFSIVGVLRSDLFGTRISRRRQRRGLAPATPSPSGPSGHVGPSGAAGPGAAPAAARPAGGAPSQPAPARGRGARGIPTLLAVTEGRLAGTTIPLHGNGILIGRNPECALVLDDDFASGRHCRIFPRDGGWFVEDLGSTNGTFLAGAKLTTAQPITIGSVLRIGRTVLELQG